MKPKIYQTETPQFKLEDVFGGHVKGWGMLQNWRGQTTRRFVVDIKGTFQNGQGTLDETFTWSDGEVQKRTWQVKQLPNGQWQGTAGDIEGLATSQISGNTMNWRYKLNVPVGKPNPRILTLTMDDWMFLIAPGQVMNITTMYKFGLPVGKITIFLQNQKAQ